jgi:hypothetical protein
MQWRHVRKLCQMFMRHMLPKIPVAYQHSDLFKSDVHAARALPANRKIHHVVAEAMSIIVERFKFMRQSTTKFN